MSSSSDKTFQNISREIDRMAQLSSSSSSAGQSRAGRRRKRPHPPVYGGIMNSFSDRNSDFVW